MKKSLFIGILCMVALLSAGCLQPNNPVHQPENKHEIPNITKLNKNGQPVFNYLYIEANNVDPRVAMGYVLDDGKQTPFFDMVVLFAANIRTRDCRAEQPTKEHSCTKSGLHLHFNGNVRHILANRGKYIKPLQDRGIKVVLGLLEDHDGVAFGTLGSWPMEDVARATNNPLWKDGYPYNEVARKKFLQEVADTVEYYGLDGVDFDDEWGSKNPANQIYNSVWPSGDYPYYSSNPAGVNAAWNASGRNIALCAAELREMLGPEKIITVYDYKAGGYLPAQVTYNDETKIVRNLVNFSGESMYGTWVADYKGGVDVIPRSQYAPIAIDLGGDRDDANQRARPLPYGGLPTMMANHLNGNYGATLFYNLLNRGRYDGTFTKQTNGDRATDRTRFFNDSSSIEPQKKMPETYLSLISRTLFGTDVIYIGEDYPQDWIKF